MWTLRPETERINTKDTTGASCTKKAVLSTILVAHQHHQAAQETALYRYNKRICFGARLLSRRFLSAKVYGQEVPKCRNRTNSYIAERSETAASSRPTRGVDLGCC